MDSEWGRIAITFLVLPGGAVLAGPAIGGLDTLISHPELGIWKYVHGRISIPLMLLAGAGVALLGIKAAERIVGATGEILLLPLALPAVAAVALAYFVRGQLVENGQSMGELHLFYAVVGLSAGSLWGAIAPRLR